jgi:hypothetical protein
MPLLPAGANKKIAVRTEDAGEGGVVRTKDLFYVGGCLLKKGLSNLGSELVLHLRKPTLHPVVS